MEQTERNEIVAPQARFDSRTGAPLDGTATERPALPPEARFDPQTGEPLDAPRPAPAVPEARTPVIAPAGALRRDRPVTAQRDAILAVLLAVLGVLLCDTLMLTRLGLGAAVCLAAILIVTLVYLWRDRRATTVYGLFCALGVLGLAASLVFSDDDPLKLLALCWCVILSTTALLELMRQRSWEPGSFWSLGDLFLLMFGRSFGKLGEGGYALFHAKREDGQVRSRRVGGVLLGLAIALPALLIVVPLLISSDAAFEGMVRSFHVEKLGLHLLGVVFGLFLALTLFSQLFWLPRSKDPEQRKVWQGCFEPSVLISFLGVLSAVYLVYLFSQGAYFLNGFRGLLPDGFTVAEYARRGFFEMCVICILNLGFVYLANFLCKKQDGRAALGVRLLSCFVCLFSLALIATSVSKMVLYIQSFGMTRLRILTTAFMLVLAVLFAAVILRLFLRRVAYLKVAAVAATLVLLGLSFANVDRIIASYNVRAYQSGVLESVDVRTLTELSDAAVPYLLELMDDPDPQVARKAQDELQMRVMTHFALKQENGRLVLSDDEYDGRGFNTVESEARTLLRQNADRIMEGFDGRWVR